MNYMVYMRGSRHDFDRWELMGNYGWGFDDILPLFLRLENATQLQHRPIETDHRGLRGDLRVSHTNYRSVLSQHIIAAANERGLPFLDYNGRQQIGVDYLQSTISNGRRFSAVDAYLNPIKHRRNLHIMVNSLVSRVIIDPVTKTARGVEFTNIGLSHRVFATKEVIVSGGPIMSPQLLWLSGIGPREDLESFKIPVLADLPVGMKYLDHTAFVRLSASHDLRNETIDFTELDSEDAEEFVERGTGKLTIPAANEVVTLLNNGFDSYLPPDNANMEMVFTTGQHHIGTSGFTDTRPDIYNATFLPVENAPTGVLGMYVIDLYPQTQGRLRMRGNTINNLPIIEFPFFKNPRDLEVLVWGAKEAVATLNSNALRRLGMRLNRLPIPDCAKNIFGTDEYWRCFIRHFANNALHAAATNKMGPSNDPEAVVDPELRVYGINKLRVADTSIAPTTVSCHTQAISYVVGEKLAQLLKKEYNLI